jgi:hypothetical protein
MTRETDLGTAPVRSTDNRRSGKTGVGGTDLPEGQTPPLPVSYGALDSPRLHHSNHHVISGLRRAAAFTFRPR